MCLGLSASGGGDTAQTVSSALHPLCHSLQAATHFRSLTSHSPRGFISERILTSLLLQSGRPPAPPLPSGRQLRGWVRVEVGALEKVHCPFPRSSWAQESVWLPTWGSGDRPLAFPDFTLLERRGSAKTALTWRAAQDNDPAGSSGQVGLLPPSLPNGTCAGLPSMHLEGVGPSLPPRLL